MSFNPNYITPDGVFEVEVSNLSKERKPPTLNGMVGGVSPKNATINKINVFNTNTGAYSTKQVYINKYDRLFFRGIKGRRESQKTYFIDELKTI